MKGSAKGAAAGAGKLKPKQPLVKQTVAKQPAKQAKGAGKKPATIGKAPGIKSRERVVPGRVTGKVVSWKGSHGFIVPDNPISHPKAQKRGNKLFLDQVDVEQELSGVGAAVSFFVYCDHTGLGAEKVIPSRGNAIKKVEKKLNPAAPVKKTLTKPSSGETTAKGKGKGKAVPQKQNEDKTDGLPDKESREMITDAPITGVVEHWGDQVGWIRPDEPVENEEFNSKTGRRKGVFFAHSSEVEGETPLTNASVIFFAYKDDRGFGASDIQIIEQGDGIKKSKAETEPKASKTSLKPQAKTTVKKPTPKQAVKGKGKGKEAKPKGPSGPDLPRERLTDSPLTGAVVSFKGKFGWVQPAEEVAFEGAVEKHGGKLYTHVQDVLESETLKPGDSVQFHVYRDESGLGAEEVIKM